MFKFNPISVGLSFIFVSLLVASCSRSYELIHVERATVNADGDLKIKFSFENSLGQKACFSKTSLMSMRSSMAELSLRPKKGTKFKNPDHGFMIHQDESLLLLSPGEGVSNELIFDNYIDLNFLEKGKITGKLGLIGRYCDTDNVADFKVDFKAWSNEFSILSEVE